MTDASSLEETRLLWRQDCEAEKRKILWACTCGKGGTANLRFDCDAESERAEVYRQAATHLREHEDDLNHNVHIGAFTASLLITAEASRELLWRKAGDAPDTYGPHPYLA